LFRAVTSVASFDDLSSSKKELYERRGGFPDWLAQALHLWKVKRVQSNRKKLIIDAQKGEGENVVDDSGSASDFVASWIRVRCRAIYSPAAPRSACDSGRQPFDRSSHGLS
jgi:hypothetical protein